MKYHASTLFVKKSLESADFSEAQRIIIEFPLKQPKRTRRLFKWSLHHLPQYLRLQQLEAAFVGVQQAVPLHLAQLAGESTAVTVQVIRQLDAGERDAEGQAASPLGFTEQIGAHFGPQAFEHQQVDAAGEGKYLSLMVRTRLRNVCWCAGLPPKAAAARRDSAAPRRAPKPSP